MNTNSNQTQHKKLSVTATLARAKSHIKKGQFTEAHQLYHSILETFPQNQQAKKGLTAITHGSVSQKHQSSPSKAQIDSVIELYSQGQIVEALNALAVLTKDYPNESQLYNISGICYKALGQLDAAISNYKRALAINPDYDDAHYNLAITFKVLGQLDAAVSSYERALAINPNNAITHNNLGTVLKDLGQLDAAVSSLERALAINPSSVEAHTNLGATLRCLDQPDAAISSLKRALAIRPEHANAHHNLGATFKDLGQLGAAVSSFEHALAINPENAITHCSLGNALWSLGQMNEAISSCKRALVIKPDYVDAHITLGHAFNSLGILKSAVSSFERALVLEPDNSEAIFNLGVSFTKLDKLDAAISCFDKVLAITPDFSLAYNNLGIVYYKLNQLDSSVSSLERAIAISPNYVDAYINLGTAYDELGQLDAATSCYKRALAIDPNSHQARFNLALLQLGNGFLSEGFKNYEGRWQWNDFPSPYRKFSIPRWTGQSLAGKNILIWGEQGVGDEVIYASIIPEFEKLDCNVGIECRGKLVEIFQWTFPWAEVREAGAINCEESEVYALFDYQIPFASIVPFFRTTLDDFRKFQKHYIPRLKEGEKKVRDNLNLQEGQLLIGVSWRSTLQTGERSKDYLNVEDLAPLKAIKGAVFLGIQYDDCLPELDRVRELGLPVRYYTDIDQKNDLASACALIGACDLVISALTAVVPISGALGVPTVKFESGINRKNPIPWFPSVRHFQLIPESPSLLMNNITNQIPELIDWSNKITNSGRYIDYLTIKEKIDSSAG